MGIDYRVVNGYVYISGNPVTDPEQIAERAEFFQKRAGYYFENWDELYAKWKVKMEALIAELTELRVPELHEYEPDEVVFEDDRDTAYVEVLEAYGRLLRCGELMWQHHSEFLLLGYGAYATFSDFCKGVLPDIPDQHIAQMVAGIDVLLFMPDAELKRLARLALETGVDSAFVDGRSPEEIDAELAQSEAGRAWLEELEQVKDPWFNMATGDGLYHYYGSWLDDPSIPYASLVGYVGALKRGRGDRAADRGARTRAGPAGGGVRLHSSTRRHARASTSCSGSHAWSSRTSRSTSSSATTGSSRRWWNKVREFGALLAKHGYLEDAEDVFQLSRHEVANGARRARPDVGHGRRAAGPEALAADRRAPQGDPRAARGLDAAARCWRRCPRR